MNIPATFNGYYDLMVNAKKHYPVVVIRVKRCHQVGVVVIRVIRWVGMLWW